MAVSAPVGARTAPLARVAVAIVGAGFAGICAALELRRAGRDDFLILERANGVGGTWLQNTYPGVACDVPSHLYALATHPNPHWSRVFAPGNEIRAYLEGIVQDEGLASRLRLETPVVDARWDETRSCWRLEVGGAQPGPVEAEVLVIACGRLTEPHIPAVDGLETFPGPIFHSSRWNHHESLAGARVAVVGTGASAVQLVPEVARLGARVTVFQRTPAWIVPRRDRPFTVRERAAFAADSALLTAFRDRLYVEGEARFASRSGDPAAALAARRAAADHLADQVRDPRLRAALTPAHAFGCKRVLLSDEFYPAIASGGATLEPSALARVEGPTLVGASGTRHSVDVLVLATGFAMTRQPYAHLVRGESGTLAEHWAGGMRSFGSTVVSGFPNLFVLDGPNAALAHNSALLMIEAQVGYLLRALAVRDAMQDRVLRVDPRAEDEYMREIDAAAASTPWLSGGCPNRYVDEASGRLTFLWPGTVERFRTVLARAVRNEFLTGALSEGAGA